MKKIIVALLLSIVNYQLSIAQIGTWKAYMAYHDITEIEKGGNILYVLASDNLYSYNTNDHSIQTYDKTTVLSDCGIAHIAWCQGAKSLVILYSNNNIDILDQSDNITNLSDYYNKSMTEDKTVYSIDINGQYAYLSTGFGIVIINVSKAEITNTYNLGFRVDYSYVENNYIYAASSTNGLYRGLMTDNLLDKSNWSRVGDYVPRTKTVDPELLALAQTLDPGGPKYNYFGFLKFTNGKLYTCNGDYSNNGTIQVLKDNDWNIYATDNISETTGVSFPGIPCLAIDPTSNDEHVITGGRNGLYEFRNGTFIKYYNSNNSPIEMFDGKTIEYQIVSGTNFDSSGNLWLLNSSAPNASLIKLSKNGEFTKYNHSEYMKNNSGGYTNKSNPGLSNIMFDSTGLMWFVNNSWVSPAFYLYNIQDDSVIAYETFINQDGTRVMVSDGIKCVVEDNDHNLWIGTDVGPLVLDRNNIYDTNPTLYQIKVPRNDGTNLADYLLTGVYITCIAIDGAGRKWFGTNGLGAYLISEDNYSEIHHFTSTNSNLLSDNVQAIAINPQTGEVFFGTDKGLCSYMSDATEPNEEMTKDNVYAYPNPVRPDYTGLITVTGLSYDADVKIVTSNGVLVAQGRSNGGMFTWDGTDLKGKRVVSGVYFVETATSTGSKGTVCKIAIVN